MPDKPATTHVSIHEIIKNRWSPRAFDPERDVADRDLLALLEAARWAPSCFNDQPWRYIVCVKSRDEPAWRAALDCLTEKNQSWARNAPVLMLAVALNNFGHNDSPNRWAMYDTGAASLNLCLQAVALGLAVHQMGGFSVEKATAVFALPEDCVPMAMLAVGYQADSSGLAEDFRATELSGRSRAALGERFYAGRWGVGYKI